MHGIEDGTSWKTCYHEEPEERRKRQLVITQQNIDEKVMIAVNKTKEELLGVVNVAVTDAVASFIPVTFDWSKSDTSPTYL